MLVLDKADQQSKASTPTTTAERPLPTVPTSTHPTSTPHPSEQDESVSGSQLHPEPMDTSTSAALATPGSQGVKVPSGASGSDSSLAKVSRHETQYMYNHVHSCMYDIYTFMYICMIRIHACIRVHVHVST